MTKVGWRRDGRGRVLPAQAPSELRAGVEANLRSLAVERVDLVNLRLPGVGSVPAFPLEEQLGALENLRSDGKLDLIGVSNVDRATAQRGLELTDVAAIQNSYNVVDREDGAVLSLAHEHGIAFVPFGPLGSAYRSGPARLAADANIAGIAERHRATPTQVALAWLLQTYEQMLLIPGTSSVGHLEENVAAGELELDDADLDLLSRPRPSRFG